MFADSIQFYENSLNVFFVEKSFHRLMKEAKMTNACFLVSDLQSSSKYIFYYDFIDEKTEAQRG